MTGLSRKRKQVKKDNEVHRPRGRNGGRPPQSGHYKELNSIPMRVPANFIEGSDKASKDAVKKQFLTIAKSLQEKNLNLKWLVENLHRILQEEKRDNTHGVRFSSLSNNALVYRKQFVPIAASFDVVSSLYTDDEKCEEYDIAMEFGDPKEVMIYTVSGSSMIDEGIRQGDELVVELIDYPIRMPNTNDLVIANLNGSVTVKKYKIEGGKHYLIPRNRKLSPIELIPGATEFYVFGLVKKLIRSY